MQKKKVLILGATGMLGHMVYWYFEQLGTYELFNSVYRTPLNESSIVCNVKDQGALVSLFDRTRPDVVINCIGALVQESKENPANAIYLNALLPHLLKDLCNQYQAKLIHISTDCVFSGKKGGYAEDDFRDADDVYGRSKALGEIFDEPHCTLRTSIIGPELKENGTGLFAWFLRQEGAVNGYTHAFWSGVTTHELAKQIQKVILHDLKGLFHITNGQKISKFELLHLFNRLREVPITIYPYSGYQADKSLLKSQKFDFEVAGFEEMVNQLQFGKIKS
jgi:dTDP-4-dehydrorhamnose reductase